MRNDRYRPVPAPRSGGVERLRRMSRDERAREASSRLLRKMLAEREVQDAMLRSFGFRTIGEP